MSIVADDFKYVVGVDTHAASHTLAIVESPNSRLVDRGTFPASPAGLSRAIAWIGRITSGELDAVLVSVEGTGSYGAVLTRRLTGDGYRVVEAPRPNRRVAKAKTDALDALAAAKTTMGMDTAHLVEPRAGEQRGALQILMTGRNQMSTERTKAINALTALLRGNNLDIDARKKLTMAQIRTVAAWRSRGESLTDKIARAEAKRLATRITSLKDELATNKKNIEGIVTDLAPELLQEVGIGPINAATILAAWSHPGRVRSEAALASLAGTCPIPASSGNTSRHRLNRGGDRRLNSAIHTIVLVRMAHDDTTRTYVERRIAEGKTKRETMRCLKRYITRQIYRTLTTTNTSTIAA